MRTLHCLTCRETIGTVIELVSDHELLGHNVITVNPTEGE